MDLEFLVDNFYTLSCCEDFEKIKICQWWLLSAYMSFIITVVYFDQQMQTLASIRLGFFAEGCFSQPTEHYEYIKAGLSDSYSVN